MKKEIELYNDMKKIVLGTIIPLIITGIFKVIVFGQKLSKARYYNYPVEFFDIDFLYATERLVMVCYYLISTVGVRYLVKIKKVGQETVLGTSIAMSFIIGYSILYNFSRILVYFEKENFARKVPFFLYYFITWLSVFVTLSKKEDFEIFKEFKIKERLKKFGTFSYFEYKIKIKIKTILKIGKNKTLLCLISFFTNNMKNIERLFFKLIKKVRIVFILIFVVFFIGFLFLDGIEYKKEYQILNYGTNNEKAVISIKDGMYHTSDCITSRDGTYKTDKGEYNKYKLDIYTKKINSYPMDSVTPETVYFHKVEIKKNKNKP